MKIYLNKKAFTLLELQTVSVIIILIFGSLFLLFQNKVKNFVTGNENIFIQNEIQKVMKYIYFDFKNVKPAVYLDKNFDIFVTGEKKKNFIYNTINIYEDDGILDNGKEIIEFYQYNLKVIDKPDIIRYFLYKNFLIRVKNSSSYKIISKYVDNFKLYYTFDKKFGLDSKNINIFFVIKLINKKGKELSEKIDLNLRVDSEYIKINDCDFFKKDKYIESIKKKLKKKYKL